MVTELPSVSPCPIGNSVMFPEKYGGVAGNIGGRLPTWISTKTSKKLEAVPVLVNGGTSRIPGVLLTFSTTSPDEIWFGLRVATTGPSEELNPLTFRDVSSVVT